MKISIISIKQINIKAPKLISTLLSIKVFYKVMLPLLIGMIKHKLLKVISLQYLHNISKNKLGMEFIVCMQINIKVSISWDYRFRWKQPARHLQRTQDRSLVISLQYVKEKVLQLLLCYIFMQNIQIFYGSPVMFIVTCQPLSKAE